MRILLLLLLTLCVSCTVEVDVPTKYERRYEELTKANMYWFLSEINGVLITQDCRQDDQTIYDLGGIYLWVLAPHKCFQNQLDTVFGSFTLDEVDANKIYTKQDFGIFKVEDTLEIMNLGPLEMTLYDAGSEDTYLYKHLGK